MSAAGRELGLSPPVVSKRIKALEERLGTRLLQRTTRHLALTESGKGFYERVVAILASVDEAEAWVSRRAAARGGCSGSARPPPSGACISRRISWISCGLSEITIDLSLSDQFVDIVAEGFDLAVRIADLQDSSLVAKRLAPSHRVLCASQTYLDAHGEPRPSPIFRSTGCCCTTATIGGWRAARGRRPSGSRAQSARTRAK